MTTFSLNEIPYIDININDEYNLRFYKQQEGNYSCNMTEFMVRDLKEITDKLNRKLKLNERK
jgi:hypothetical protein